jgi:hypothetical protein
VARLEPSLFRIDRADKGSAYPEIVPEMERCTPYQGQP